MTKLPMLCGDRDNAPRPCERTDCRYNLAGSLASPSGRRPGEVVERDHSETCALDVAEDGGHTLRDVGRFFGVGRERVRQVERDALKKLRAVCERLGVDLEDIIHRPQHPLGESPVVDSQGRQREVRRIARRRYERKKKASAG